MKASDLLTTAKKQVGNNYKKYCSAIGVNTDWCVIFIWWLFYTNKASSLFNNGKKAYNVGEVYDWAHESGLLVSKSNIKAGDLVIFDWAGNSFKYDHIGLFVSKNTDGTYRTIEGNTGANVYTKSKVMYRDRYPRDVIAVIRPKYSSSGVTYTTGTYKCLYAMNVRTGAGTGYRKKKVSELTMDGKKNATSKKLTANATYKKGTLFTVTKIVKNTDGSIWGKTPSGYVCLKGKTKKYCEKI